MRHAVLHALHISTFVLLWYVLDLAHALQQVASRCTTVLPLLITALHFALKVRARGDGAPRAARAAARLADGGRAHVPTGAATALDIALSNLSALISVAYYTIVKSAVPIWILLFSVCGQRLRPTTVLVIAASSSASRSRPSRPRMRAATTTRRCGCCAARWRSPTWRTTRGRRRGAGAADAADAPAAAVEDGGAAFGDSPRPILGLVLVSLLAVRRFRWACTQVLLTPHAMHAPLGQHRAPKAPRPATRRPVQRPRRPPTATAIV